MDILYLNSLANKIWTHQIMFESGFKSYGAKSDGTAREIRLIEPNIFSMEAPKSPTSLSM